MKLLLRAVIAVLISVASGAAEVPRNYAITHATAIPEPGSRIDNATIVLRDGLIVSIEAGGAVPSDAVEIDGTDRFVYAGLIDAQSDLQQAAKESDAGPARRAAPASADSAPGAAHPLALIHPEYRAAESLRPFTEDRKRSMEKLRDLGFTVVLAVPNSGILRGTSAAILLAADRPVAEILLSADVAQHASFERSRFGAGYPTSLMGSIAAFRQALLDAQRYSIWKRRYEANPGGMQRPELHSAYEALRPILERKSRLIFHTSDPHDSMMADRLGREFDLDIAVASSSYEAEYAQTLAATGRMLIVSTGFPKKPELEKEDERLDVSAETMRRYLDAAAGPARLHESGVRFALTTAGLETKSSFHKQMRKILDAGLSEQAALAALTTVPAQILGLERVIGTLAPGKIANLVVSDGPLFAKETKIREVFVDGTRHQLDAQDKPQGDPDAVVDPRGKWSVTVQMGPRTLEREWTIGGSTDAYRGSSDSGEETIEFESIELAGNLMTVVFPSRGGRPAMEATLIVGSDSFKGTAEMGPRSIGIEGTRTSGPQGGAR